MRFARQLVVTSIALFGFGASPALAADSPQVSLRVSSPITWFGSTVTVKVTANQPGWVNLAQSRRYFPQAEPSTCGWQDKYATDLYGVHGSYLPRGADPAAQQFTIDPDHPVVLRLPAASLEYGAGDWPWANTQTWDGCKTRWTPYDRLSVFFATPNSPGGSYWAQAEQHVLLQRIL